MAEIKSGEGEMRRKLSYGGSIPLLGLGTFTYDERDSLDAVAMKAIKIGYRHFDTASLYGSEEAIGKAIKKAIENETVKREDIFVTTKLWCNEHHDPLSALNASLKRLGLDYVDSYLIHWPVKLKPWASYMVPKEDDFDEMDLETTWNHMEKCVELGLTKTIGVSNFSSKKLLHLLDFASLPPAINQVEMHVMWRQRKLREVCSSRNVHLTAYSPLGSPWNPYGLKNLLKDPIVNSIASKHEATPAQVALSWILSMGGSAVVKSFNESRLEENMASFGLKLDEQDLQEIDKLEEKKMATGEFLINATTGQYKNIQELWDGEI
ncbi:NADPH-dependent aldo-keto reductase, chloroplastic [Cucumis sativus]|uniref:NADP-dependent oxidoreductase domain-containing protein n=1 Tax=Cucumis sativus TaxID=3659 RepID=A0A0A0LTV7_CUCSA|nr:NADPH-dependent aldo-keto reductase, chloroplastic [Cucumis sativus]KGN64212.1 hypothetical protein Csa_013497 [Cucumis sativus]